MNGHGVLSPKVGLEPNLMYDGPIYKPQAHTTRQRDRKCLYYNDLLIRTKNTI